MANTSLYPVRRKLTYSGGDATKVAEMKALGCEFDVKS